MQLIGFCIPRIFLVTTAYNKHDIHSDSRLADVMSTHQFHEWNVIQPFNDFTMRIYSPLICTLGNSNTLYLSTLWREFKKWERKREIFFSFSKNGIFLWAVAFFVFHQTCPIYTCLIHVY